MYTCTNTHRWLHTHLWTVWKYITVLLTLHILHSDPGPSISSVEVTRLNMTTFNLSVSLAYTGGGAITHFRISFRNTGTTSWHPLGDYPATPSPDSSLVWNWVMSRNEFDTSIPLTFNVLAVNSYGLVSTEAQVNSPSGMLWSAKTWLNVFTIIFQPPFSLPQFHHPSIVVPLLIPVCHLHYN